MISCTNSFLVLRGEKEGWCPRIFVIETFNEVISANVVPGMQTQGVQHAAPPIISSQTAGILACRSACGFLGFISLLFGTYTWCS